MGRTPKLGQHFLKSSAISKVVAGAANLQPGETVLEIGPGKGALTRELLATGARVVAVEKDASLVSLLRERFAVEIASRALTVFERDIRDFDSSETVPGPYVLAANIPYYITGEILRHFLSAAHKPRRMVLLMQKEVAQRIVARVGKESILSLSVKAYGMPRYIQKVGRREFSPPPAVDSAILAIEDITSDFFKDVSEEHFFQIVRGGFASKRKLLASNLSRYGKEKVLSAFASCGVSEKARAEDLTLPQWKCVAQRLSE